MAQVYYLENMTYEEVDKLRNDTIIMLSMGPLEAHGPHLPLGVDIYGALKLTEMAAQKLAERGRDVALLPVLPYTLADVAMPFKGTITLGRATVVSLLLDIAKSLSKHGFKKLVINCHHLERENLNALYETAQKAKDYGISVLVSNAIIKAIPMCVGLMQGKHPELDFHAGEVETAFCLWQYPDLVKKDILETLPPNWSDIRQKFKQGAKDFVQAGGQRCYFGDPGKATVQLGRKIYNIQAKTLADEVEKWLNKSNQVKTWPSYTPHKT